VETCKSSLIPQQQLELLPAQQGPVMAAVIGAEAVAVVAVAASSSSSLAMQPVLLHIATISHSSRVQQWFSLAAKMLERFRYGHGVQFSRADLRRRRITVVSGLLLMSA